MTYKFITHPVGDYKMAHFRGKGNNQILVKKSTSPKKFLRYFEELKKAGCLHYSVYDPEFISRVYETDLIASILNSATDCPDAIVRLKINESCLANDGHDLYNVTRISRHLCHCECLPYAW